MTYPTHKEISSYYGDYSFHIVNSLTIIYLIITTNGSLICSWNFPGCHVNNADKSNFTEDSNKGYVKP